MKSLLARLCFALVLLCSAVAPVFAQAEIPEPFCGDLAQTDCDLLRTSNSAMLDLNAYTTAVTYKLVAKGLPELAPTESGVTLRIDSRYAFNEAARQSIRFFAVQSRKEPLAAVEAIGQSPELLINLYQGMTADETFTLDVSKDWAKTLSESGDTIEWPATTHVTARLVDGMLYIDIHELKAFIPSLKAKKDWVAIELVKIMQALADKGTFKTLADNVAASSAGRSVWGLDPAMLNLITSMRAVFGRPKALEPFMKIKRDQDTALDNQKGAVYQIDFAALNFILSDEFRNLLMQAVEVTTKSEGEKVDSAEISSMVSLFWLLAPSIFRDLKISGSYTIGVADNYQHAGKTVIHWDLKTVLQAIGQFSGEKLPDVDDESYIDFITETQNSAFNAAVTVAPPDDAEVISPTNLDDLEALGYEAFNPDQQSSEQDNTTDTITDTITSGRADLNSPQGPSAKDQTTPPAIADTKTLSDTDPTCDAALNAAASSFTGEDYAASIETLTNEINAACAESAYAHQLLGAAYYKHYEQIYNGENKDQADPNEVYRTITLASKAIELDHNNSRAYYYRGLAFESFKDYGHAIDDLSHAIELLPDDPYAYFPRARIYEEIGQRNSALNDYKKFLDLYTTEDEWRAQVEKKVKEME
ncbi:MAG: tetratricopeptide repeat protein [Caldilineaceae bacterium]